MDQEWKLLDNTSKKAGYLRLTRNGQRVADFFPFAHGTNEAWVREQARLIVGMMNANYPGSVTAETFSKLGKTDIRLRVDEGNALISECKVWQGPSAYVDALEQLFRYLTWRQNYGVLIVFSRRKDMTAAVSIAKEGAQTHVSFTAGSLATQSLSRFSTRHNHPQDKSNSVEVFNIFVDVSS